jgi:hypothetical protein
LDISASKVANLFILRINSSDCALEEHPF